MTKRNVDGILEAKMAAQAMAKAAGITHIKVGT